MSNDSIMEVSAKMLANVLHDLNPGHTVEQWLSHVQITGNDPKAFFGSNGEGHEEYIAFVNRYDKDKEDRRIAKLRKAAKY